MRRLEPDSENSASRNCNSTVLLRRLRLPADDIKIQDQGMSFRQEQRKVHTQQTQHIQSLSSLAEHLVSQQPHSEHFKSGDIIILTEERLIMPCSFQTGPMFSSLAYRENYQHANVVEVVEDARVCFENAQEQTKFMIKTRGPSFYREKLQLNQQQSLYENFHSKLTNIIMAKQKKVIRLKGKSPERKKKSQNMTLPSLNLSESTNRYLRTHTKEQRSTENSLKSRYLHITLNSSPFKSDLKTPQKLLNKPKNIPIFLGNQKSSSKGIRVFSTSKEKSETGRSKDCWGENIIPTCCPSNRQSTVKTFNMSLSTERKKQGKKIQSIHTIVSRNNKTIKLHKNV